MSETKMDMVDQLLGFDPRNLSAFQEKGPKQDPNIYKTNPKDSKAEDGVYRSVVKVLLNPFNLKESIVPQTTYYLKSQDGSRLVRSSLSLDDRNCPIFKAWKRHWFSGDETRKEFAKKMFDQNNSQWVLVQILEDENKPELVGQFKVMKLAKDIYDKINTRMNPSSASKAQPYPVMDYVIGLSLNIEVQPGPDDPKAPERKQREISYSLSNLGDYATVIKTDGTPLLTEEEIELVDTYVNAINDSQNGKTEKKRKEGLKALEEVKPQIRPIYQKVAEYVKENVKDTATGKELDVAQYCGFQPWDDNTKEFVNKWIEIVDAQIDPSTISYDEFKKAQQAATLAVEAPATAEPEKVEEPVAEPEEDDLPF